MGSLRAKLSTLWIFATVNYLYCDVVTLMDPDRLKGFIAGNIGGVAITPAFLLAAGVLVEIPMAMVILSRLLNPRAARVTNVVAGATMTAVQLLSLLPRTPALYYIFFSVVEIGTTAAIIWLAWRWSGQESRTPLRVGLASERT